VTIQAIHSSETTAFKGGLLPLLIGCGVLVFLLASGDIMLQDSDVFWQIETGRWILAHGAVPTMDLFSFTKSGAAWLSSSWLAQVIFALAMQAGWAGPVIVTALAASAAFALFAAYLERHASALVTTALAMLAVWLCVPHLLTRPHVLAMPLMVAWMIGLIEAADRRSSPPWALVIVIALWANIHGGFGLGLVLIGPAALEALRLAAPAQRLSLALRWCGFGVAALAACCATPYGWNTLIAASKILSLGELLTTVSEWAPPDFSRFGAFEASILGLFGIALWRGLTVPWPRLLLVLGLLHMALAHVRSIESFALLVPLVLARPWAEQFASRRDAAAVGGGGGEFGLPGWAVATAALGIVATTIAVAPRLNYTFIASQIPEQALAAAQRHGASRILNAYEFGGYLISRHVPVFIDGRAELYGETMAMNLFRVVAGRKPEALDDFIETYRIDATMLPSQAPVIALMDRRPGWHRLYADDIAVVHVRDDK
jgi:hypothetical protein